MTFTTLILTPKQKISMMIISSRIPCAKPEQLLSYWLVPSPEPRVCNSLETTFLLIAIAKRSNLFLSVWKPKPEKCFSAFRQPKTWFIKSNLALLLQNAVLHKLINGYYHMIHIQVDASVYVAFVLAYM